MFFFLKQTEVSKMGQQKWCLHWQGVILTRRAVLYHEQFDKKHTEMTLAQF